MLTELTSNNRFQVKQVFEMAEIFGFESRNKYLIRDESGREFAYAAEQQKGLLGFLMRQFLGHWRSFTLHFYSPDRREFMFADHPFRWYWQRLEVREADGRPLGVVERRFAFLSKKFDVHNSRGEIIMQVCSPIWRIWTFPFMRGGREVARILKKWSGIGYEIFTDRDNFIVEYVDSSLNQDERALVLAAAIYIDLMFFEHKGNGGGLPLPLLGD